MKYCGSCKIIIDTETCPVCGGRLREAKAEDFCLIAEKDALQGKITQNMLVSQGIDCVSLPSGSGVRSAFALPLENLKLYVPYARYEKANGILRANADENTEKLRKELLANADKLHIKNDRAEKRIRKTLALQKGADTVGFCKELIACAKLIKNEGSSYGAISGNYITVYGEVNVTIGSGDYEILSAWK